MPFILTLQKHATDNEDQHALPATITILLQLSPQHIHIYVLFVLVRLSICVSLSIYPRHTLCPSF